MAAYLAVYYAKGRTHYEKICEAEIQASNDAELLARLRAWMQSLGLDPDDDDDLSLVNWIPI